MLQILAKNTNPDDYSKLVKNPTLQIEDDPDASAASNPIWSRPKGLEAVSDSDWLKIPGVIGHTDSEDGDIPSLKEGSDNVIFDADVGASDGYGRGAFSRARLITLKNGMLTHQSIVGKEE